MRRTKAQERAALERAILRALRASALLFTGKLADEVQAELYGLERERRRVGK